MYLFGNIDSSYVQSWLVLSRNTVRVAEVARVSLNINPTLIKKKESPFIGKKGWAVNSIVFTFKSSNLLSPNSYIYLFTYTAYSEQYIFVKTFFFICNLTFILGIVHRYYTYNFEYCASVIFNPLLVFLFLIVWLFIKYC